MVRDRHCKYVMQYSIPIGVVLTRFVRQHFRETSRFRWYHFEGSGRVRQRSLSLSFLVLVNSGVNPVVKRKDKNAGRRGK